MDQLAQALVQRGGYNPADAANAAKGPRAQELAREFLGGGVNQPGQANPTDYNALAQQQIKMQQQANQPAVASLQAQLPEVKANYQQQATSLEAQKAPLQQRYQNIIDSLKTRESQDTAQIQTAQAREFGKRGIPLSSGAYDQALIEKTLPISQQYGQSIKDVGISQEQSLQDLSSRISGLTGQQTDQERQINNAIAQLQSGGASSAITQALQQYQFNQQQQTQQQQLAQQSQQSAAEQALKQLMYQQTTLPESQAAVASTKATTQKTLKDLNTQFGGGWS